MADLAARRHALNLPAGSIRATHVLGVVGLVCAIILVPSRNVVPIPPYLVYLTFLALGHFFAAHGTSIATRDDPAPSPLYLPGGVVRVLVVLMLLGTIGWKLYSDHQFAESPPPAASDDSFPYHTLTEQYEASLNELKNQPYMPLVILGGFLVGVILHGLFLREGAPAAWHDLEAWISVLALVGLGAAAVVHLFVQTNVEVPFDMALCESILGGLVAFYFGARS